MVGLLDQRQSSVKRLISEFPISIKFYKEQKRLLAGYKQLD